MIRLKDNPYIQVCIYFTSLIMITSNEMCGFIFYVTMLKKFKYLHLDRFLVF